MSEPRPSEAAASTPSSDELAAHMAADLAEIERTRMPFGKFGPGKLSTHGTPIYDLPVEYLGWFAKKGFPKGRLGVLLHMVYQMKVDGNDLAFDGMRRRAGGKAPLRAPKGPRSFHFE